MNVPASLLDAQTLALLHRLGREQEARTRRIRDDAATQATEIVRKARAEARARVHQAVIDTRRDDALALARRRAALDTQDRQRRQSTLREWLEQAWLALPAALQARWLDPSQREQWCVAALDAARCSLLQHDQLIVEVSPRWSTLVAPIVLQHTGAATQASVVAVEGLDDGLRIRAGHACVDATVSGLLAPRQRIAAELLAEFLHRTSARSEPEASA